MFADTDQTAEQNNIKTLNINILTEFIAQKTGNKTQQSTTIHDIFINNLPSISTCRLPYLGVTNHIHTAFLRHSTSQIGTARHARGTPVSKEWPTAPQ
ncbi:hypothetical protein [Candidatus Symbiopectobacterium sp.]|uniref:hypothetical protein n=1 Tax=Candidatus Symbiopectobacterium sp. TaxID=2816440 RepID=UPI0025C3F385|nr:hypothetical protein [Candidatus Symbiopectobacterium sp.]